MDTDDLLHIETCLDELVGIESDARNRYVTFKIDSFLNGAVVYTISTTYNGAILSENGESMAMAMGKLRQTLSGILARKQDEHQIALRRYRGDSEKVAAIIGGTT